MHQQPSRRRFASALRWHRTAPPAPPRRSARRRGLAGLLALALWLLAGPLAAYTVYLKDGSRIVIKEKYRVEGDKAIITLPNGSLSSIPLGDIDVARTEEANKTDLGSAVVIQGGKAQPLTNTPAPPPRGGRRLGDLITERSAATAPPQPEPRRPATTQPTPVLKTAGGAIDLATLAKNPFRQESAAADLSSTYSRLGFSDARIYQGTQARRAFVLLLTPDEEAVMRALSASAEALLAVQRNQPDAVGELELLMTSPNRERAGQFLLTPEQAADLASKRIEPVGFFLANVQF